jgi:prepilin-type N-terminal cleavage/methylation domain-containing protein
MRRGLTLVELMVALAILAIAMATVGLALPRLRPTSEGAVLKELSDARVRAIRTGDAVLLSRGELTIRFLPDGSSRTTQGRSPFSVRPLSGEIREER